MRDTLATRQRSLRRLVILASGASLAGAFFLARPTHAIQPSAPVAAAPLPPSEAEPFTGDVAWSVDLAPGLTLIHEEGCVCSAATPACCLALPVPKSIYTAGDPRLNATTDTVRRYTPIQRFQLDVLEVTVAQFRTFVSDYPASLPPAGSGTFHGRADTGWSAGFTREMPATRADLEAALQCHRGHATWTSQPSLPGDLMPINCVTWFEAFAYCASNSGRLPSQDEWEAAAAGSESDRPFPWGDQPPDAAHALFQAQHLDAIPRFAGIARYGHLALAGGVAEWTYDCDGYRGPILTRDPPKTTCPSQLRVVKGGSYGDGSPERLARSTRTLYPASLRAPTHGFRCAYEVGP